MLDIDKSNLPEYMKELLSSFVPDMFLVAGVTLEYEGPRKNSRVFTVRLITGRILKFSNRHQKKKDSATEDKYYDVFEDGTRIGLAKHSGFYA